MHSQQLGVRGGLAQIVPRGVVLVQALVTAEEEERGDDGIAGGVLHVVVALSHAHGFLEQDVAEVDVGDRAFWAPRDDVRRQGHVRLNEHVGTEGSDHAVGLDVLVHAEDSLLDALVVQDGLRGVELLEVEIDASVDQVQRHQAGLALQGNVVGVEEVWVAGGGQLGLALGLAQLGEHLCARALGALLLGDGIVGAVEAGGHAVLAWLVAFANALYLAAVTALQKGQLAGSRHGRQRGTHLSQARLTGVLEGVEDMVDWMARAFAIDCRGLAGGAAAVMGGRREIIKFLVDTRRPHAHSIRLTSLCLSC